MACHPASYTARRRLSKGERCVRATQRTKHVAALFSTWEDHRNLAESYLPATSNYVSVGIEINPGQSISLRQWTLDRDENAIVVSGYMESRQQKTDVKVQIEINVV